MYRCEGAQKAPSWAANMYFIRSGWIKVLHQNMSFFDLVSPLLFGILQFKNSWTKSFSLTEAGSNQMHPLFGYSQGSCQNTTGRVEDSTTHIV